MTLSDLYQRERTDTYNCLDFAAEAWKIITGDDIELDMRARNMDRRKFKRLKHPVSPCLAVMSFPASEELHVGVYLERNILHLGKLMVEYLSPSLAARSCNRKIRYYACL